MDEEELKFCNISSVQPLSIKGMISARVVDVYDGDTITVIVPVWIASEKQQQESRKMSRVNVRIAGIDTAEMRGGSTEDREMAIAARDALINLIMSSNGHENRSIENFACRKNRRAMFERDVCLVRLDASGFDKYGRVLARVLSWSVNDDFGNILLTRGLARKYM